MKSNKKIKIVLTGGGTGGHITPLISVYRELIKLARKKEIELKFIYIGPTRNSKGLFSADGIKVWPLFTGRFRRYITPKSIILNCVDIFKVAFGFLQATTYLICFRPNIMFSKGGYGSFPTTVVAWLLKIPVVIHESDSIPGATNRFLSEFAKKIIVSFPGKYKQLPNKKIVELGTPLRDMFGIGKKESKKLLNLEDIEPIIFVTGASQGAEQINQLIFKNLENLIKKYEIIHQVGDKNYKKVKQQTEKLSFYNSNRYHIYPYLNEKKMIAAYVAADLVISRASSTNIFEIAVLGKPSILIPLPTSSAGHQLKNAQIYEEAGACIVLNPFSVTANQLLNIVNQLIADEQRLQTMSEAALLFSKPNAAQDIAKLILKTVYDKQK